MKLISVNIGEERSIPNGKASGKTGIYKLPTSQPVQITPTGIPEDAICDTKHHGGFDQALYVYGQADYLWWTNELGQQVGPGTFGDNLTISDLESAQISVGDILQVGAVTLQVTSPRSPCVTLAARMGDSQFTVRFRKAERPGLYCRVLHTGTVHVGDPVTLERYRGETISILEMFRDDHAMHLSEARLRQHLAAPIDIRSRTAREKQLRKLLEKSGQELQAP